MDKSTPTVTTSSKDVEANIGEAEETIENIEIEADEKQPSIDEIAKTQKTIGDI